MRFSETPVTDDLTSSPSETGVPNIVPPATNGGEADRTPEKVGRETVPNQASERASAERERAGKLIEHIGNEFSRLRRVGRSGAWADLQNQVAENGRLLVVTGTMTFDKWIATLKEIEEFRKTEGGTLESAGDILATWLTEDESKPKKRVKAVSQ